MKRKISLLTSLLVMVSTPAWALGMEYYTYGGYNAIVLALQKVSLIFSDGGYNALYGVIMVAAIYLGVASKLVAAAAGRKSSLLSFAPAFLLGVGIYFALIVPKGSLTVYDPTMNRFQTIGGIPNGLVMVAGGLNKIEQGIVDIIDTSGNVDGYKRTAGGLGFNMLHKASGGSFGLGNTYIGMSMSKYVDDCVRYELRRPGTELTEDKLQTKSTDFWDDFKDARNPALWTVFYDEINTNGEPKTCADAYGAINTYLSNTSNMATIVSQACSAIGFDTQNASELQRCRENMSEFVSYVYRGEVTISPEIFLRQMAIVHHIENALMSGDTDVALKAIASRGLMTSGISMGIVANEWLPVMRAIFTAIAIGLVPFICLFIPTGFIGKALSLIAGFFIWLSCWGITDAIIHGIATDYAVQAMDTIRANKIGYAAIMLFPNEMEKALSLFGFARTAGIMMATIMTGMIISFGGHALAMMAGNIQGQLQGTASQAGHIANTGEGMSQQIEAGRKIQQARDNAYKYRFNTDSAARSALKMGQTGGAINAMNQFGGKDAFADAMAGANALGHKRQIAGSHAQQRHEIESGINTMESLTQQAHGKISLQEGHGKYVSNYDAAGSMRKDIGAAGGLMYDNKSDTLVSAQGATISSSEAARITSQYASSAVEKLATQVSKSASQEEAMSHLIKSGMTEQDAHQFTEAIKGNANWGRGIKESDQSTHDNTYQKGVDSSLGVSGGKAGVGVGVAMKGNVSETDKESSSRSTDKSVSMGYSKDWGETKSHYIQQYLSNETSRSQLEKYATNQGWSDVKETSQQYSQMKTIESSMSVCRSKRRER